MNRLTARRLVALNRRFYSHHAASFSASRERPWRGWERLLQGLPEPDGRPFSVLDVGCGNARFARFLAERREDPFVYLGLDVSSELLTAARGLVAELPTRVDVELDECELVDGNLGSQLGERRFDLVVLFGVLHHLPRAATRHRVMRQLSELLEPGGTLAMTLWHFDRHPRYAARQLGWEEYNRGAAEELDLAQLEQGDHLLTWRGNRTVPRYCHLVDEDEETGLIAASGLRETSRFVADGPTGEDNLYLLLVKER